MGVADGAGAGVGVQPKAAIPQIARMEKPFRIVLPLASKKRIAAEESELRQPRETQARRRFSWSNSDGRRMALITGSPSRTA